MKRLAALIAVLLACPAFAEVAPTPTIFYDEATGVEYFIDPMTGEYFIIEEEIVEPVQAVAPVANSAPAIIQNRSAVAIAPKTSVPATRSSAANRAPAILAGRAAPTTGRTVTSRTATSRATTPARTTTTRSGTVSRAGASVTNVSRVPTSAPAAAVTSATPTNVARATSIVQTDTVNEPLYTGRGVSSRISRPSSGVVISPSVVQTPATRSASLLAEPTAQVAEMDVNAIEELAKMTDYCKAQYTQCMDQFCDVLDDNQGRCSCSANLSKYADVETSLKQMTEELQNVAQQIQYIGLTRDEIDVIFTQTEAEAAMANRTDTTKLRRDLDAIKGMIIDVNTASTESNTFLGLDMSGLLDFSFDSTGFDFSNLFNTNAGSVSNQRGTDLFKTATTRCRAAVLTSCQASGVDINVITNTYDLEIDKQCLIYERELDDANTQMNQTVMNARNVLSRARLLVDQQKNQYDLRGCVNALDECMQDDFVCGTNYENCLDPTGKYIVSGEIIVGSKPGLVGGGVTQTTSPTDGLYTVWNYGVGTDANKLNAWGNGNLDDFIGQFIKNEPQSIKNMVGFLQQKIGYNDKGKNYGMCITVLNKCQDVSYSGTGTARKYELDNKVVENYLYRTLALIKAEQDEVMSEYAEDCIADITACLAQNGYGIVATTDSDYANQQLINSSAEKACSAVVNTCSSITGETASNLIKAAGQ